MFISNDRTKRSGQVLVAAVVAVLALARISTAQLSGTISADGSSTVAPITMAIAEAIRRQPESFVPRTPPPGAGPVTR